MEKKKEERKVTKEIDPDQTKDTHAFMVLGTRFEIDKRYEIIDPIGSGAYGVVVAAKDTALPEGDGTNLVAIKKIVKAFDHRVFSLRTYRELKIQRLLEHENVLGIKRILKPKDPKTFNEIYVISELMETDLAQIIKSNQSLTDDHIQFFLYQLLRGLKYIHSAGIYHRDLKPRNLLINSNCDLKICDFGLARADIPSLQNQSTALTDYIATRWYRAPEVILSWKKYTAAIDVWSVGCILAELIIRKPLLPAASEEEQLNMITKLLGNPSSKLINQIENEKNRDFVLQLPKREGKDFHQIFKGGNPNAIDLLKRMLTYDPEERITVNEALAHPYLKQLHFPDDEPTTEPVSSYDFEFEKFSLGKDDFKELIYEEILLYHSDEAAFEYIKNKRKYPDGNLSIRYGNRFRKAYKTDGTSQDGGTGSASDK